MNEFDLQGWERELQAWRRRLASQDAPVVRAEIDEIARDIGDLRQHCHGDDAEHDVDEQARCRVERRLVRLLALYDVACRGGNPRFGSA
jgi:hypothetical protein